MKKQLLLLCAILISSFAISQTKLSLKINHKLGSNPFAFNDTAYTNLGNKINVTRLEYYLTVVSITHDGGTLTPIDKVLLIDAGSTTLDSLTSLTITNLEKVTIAVGVKSTLNHLDPSLYASSHPLAPKSPSMHWGWTPGYRFVAMEGRSFSVTPDRQYEMHSLGDVNYFHTTITTAGVTTTGEKTIELNADYLEALRDINVSNGPLDHGDYGNNISHLNNFRDYVFTSVEGNPSVSTKEIKKEEIKFTLSPNPINEGENLAVTFDKEVENANLIISDLTGRIVYNKLITSKNILVGDLAEGSYLVSIKKSNLVLASKKLLVVKSQ